MRIILGLCCACLIACDSGQPLDGGPDADADADVEPDADADTDADTDADADADVDPDVPGPIEVFFAETFEGWDTADLASDAITARWQTAAPNWRAGQAIVDAGGEHGEVWQCSVAAGENYGFERFLLLGEPFEELWFSSDLYVDPEFEHISAAGYYSGKMLFGFMGGGQIVGGEWSEDLSPDGNAWWVHGVWGSSGNLMPYIYDQLEPGRAIGEEGNIPIPRGYWVHITRRVRLNTPGVADGLFEVYADGVLAMQVTDITMRSAEQGVDYGLIEGLRMSYFHGGSGPDFASPRDTYIRVDNLMVFRFTPGSEGYLDGPAPAGHTIPIVRPTASQPVSHVMLRDELFTEPSGTISCTGHPLLTIPPAGTAPVLKEISLPSGTISFAFSKFEPGYDYGDRATIVVRVYAGRGDGRTLLWTFGREDAGHTMPEGTYTIESREATIEYQPGNNWGARRGWVLDYWQNP